MTRTRYLLPLVVAIIVGSLPFWWQSQLDQSQTVRAAEPVANILASVAIAKVPHVQQKPDFCGEACAAMFLSKLGRSVDQDYVFDKSGLDPIHGRGCYTKELATALKAIGFQIGDVWYSVKTTDAEREMHSQFQTLHRDLVRGVPSIICMHYNDQPNTTEHFRLILGYDASTDEVLYHEPAAADGAYLRMKREMLLDLWPLKYRTDRWTIIRMPLEPVGVVNELASSSHTDADFAQHIRRLKKRLPSGDFQIVIQKPFVVVGDESLDTVKRRSVETVKWAVDRIKRDYFAKDPDEIIDIWLFKDKASYESNTVELFGEKPGTPFGYYSPTHRALVMNISTGGGTLVHEIVHPFMASNFRACPSWFNEGLASLYEQCRDNQGHIWGSTNWRLRGLQIAIASDRVPTFKELCSTTTNEFYREDLGTNYSQARYLCYYLQEQGKLVDYYHAFRKNAAADPGGYATLAEVLGEKDMQQFKKKWEQYVTKLRY
ncbi:MAG: hypothetical protein ACI9HK_003928 [Pirellulaceae bacterium]|jgi:hypothetical protein